MPDRRPNHAIHRVEYEPQRISYELNDKNELRVDGSGNRRAGGDWINDKNPFKCECGQKFTSKQAAREHLVQVNSDENIAMEVYKKMYLRNADIRHVLFLMEMETDSRSMGVKDIAREKGVDWSVNNVDELAHMALKTCLEHLHNTHNSVERYPDSNDWPDDREQDVLEIIQYRETVVNSDD